MKPRGRNPSRRSAIARKGLCLVLVFMQIGCRSVYRLHCTSEPAPAGVLIGQKFLGETTCTIKVPRDSDWIHDGRVELRFCLPNGQEQTRLVDLRGREPSHPLAEIVATPFVLAGVGLLWIGQDDDKDDDLFSRHDDDNGEELSWLGLGALGIGAGVYLLLGGDFGRSDRCQVHAIFGESAP